MISKVFFFALIVSMCTFVCASDEFRATLDGLLGPRTTDKAEETSVIVEPTKGKTPLEPQIVPEAEAPSSNPVPSKDEVAKPTPTAPVDNKGSEETTDKEPEEADDFPSTQ